MLSVVLRRAAVAAAVCLSLASLSAARADEPPFVVVERTKGEPLRGRLLDLSGRTFRVQLADGSVVEVPEREVREVRFEAPAAPAPESPYPTVHRAPTASIAIQPGTVEVSFVPSRENEYVVTTTELWRRTGDGPWAKVRSMPPMGAGVFEDAPPDPRAAYTYKVVSVAEADADDPVVQRHHTTVPAAQVRKESEILGPVTPGPRFYVVPMAVFADGSALVQVHAWIRKADAQACAWWEHPFRVEAGNPIGRQVDGLDFSTGATLEAARVETKPGAPSRLVVRLRHADLRNEEIDDDAALPSAIGEATTPRGIVTSAPPSPTPRDRDAEVRAALASQRPLTLNFPLETPLRDVLPLLGRLTGVDVVASSSVDQDAACVRFDVREVPQAEVLALAFEMTELEAKPWCGVLWLTPRGAGEPWVRPAVEGPAGALLERARVNLELERFPLLDTLELLSGQTGLNIVASGSARDLLDDEALTTTTAARDLSLRDALTLIVDGTGVLHWHARGSVVQVLTWSERPTREVLLEQILRGIETADLRLVRMAAGVDMDDTGSGIAMAELARTVLALGAKLRPLTVEKLARALRVERAASGNWNLVGVAEQQTTLDAAPAAVAAPWEVKIDTYGPTRFLSLSLERQELLPVPDVRALARAGADLWIEPTAQLLGPLTGDALGLDLRTSRAAVATIEGPVATLLRKPDDILWQQQLSYLTLEREIDLLVRTQSGRLFLAHVNKEAVTERLVLRFTPLAEATPALREATDLADAGDVVAALAVVDRILAANPENQDALLVRAQLRLTRGDREGANADAQHVLRALPDHAMALTIAAYARPDDDLTGRLQLCNAALRGDPAHVRALVLRADVNAQLGRRDDALHDIREARRLDPGAVTVWVTSARVALAFGDVDDAQASVEKALSLDPRDTRARYAQAKVRQARGDLNGALRELRSALESARGRDQEAAEVIQKEIDALSAHLATEQAPAPARPAWKITIDAAKHGEIAMLRLASQQAVPQAQGIGFDFDLWVDPVGPSIGVPAQFLTTTLPGAAIAPLSGVEPDASGTRSLTWTDRLQGASLVAGFRFLVRTSGGELYEGRVERRGEGVLELSFTRP